MPLNVEQEKVEQLMKINHTLTELEKSIRHTNNILQLLLSAKAKEVGMAYTPPHRPIQ